jgi:carbon-monoxide dehydrogenase catalytic subunit
MEFIQRKSVDDAVEHFLPKAADEGHTLAWDRFEWQLPECGFCESGLSCRDCLQGPCISHPFVDSDKRGVCGKDKDMLAAQSLLRLVVKGTTATLDQVSDFAEAVLREEIAPKKKAQAARMIDELERLLSDGSAKVMKSFPKGITDSWKASGIHPEGLARDLFKAAQKVEGGVTSVEDTLLWAFKASLLGCVAEKLQGGLKRSVFGDAKPTTVEVSLGVLAGDGPTILLYGRLSPVLKQRIAAEAEKKKVRVLGVCTDPLLPPYTFSPVTNYGSQEIPLLTGAVDLIVTGDQFVHPSLAKLARDWQVAVVETGLLKREKNLAAFAKRIVETARQSHGFRREIPKDIPEGKESAIMGFCAEDLDAKKIVKALDKGKIKGIAILSGSNNVKFSQDSEIVTMATEFLKRDILCVSHGDASVGLAKYGFLNPDQRNELCGAALTDLLSSLGKKVPAVLDLGSAENGGAMDFLLAIAGAGRKPLKDYPLVAVFCEANRSTEVSLAMGTVAMGVPVYFWPCLPVTGSPTTMEALSGGCEKKFGAKLHVLTDKKMEALAKANLVVKALEGYGGPGMSGRPWVQK